MLAAVKLLAVLLAASTLACSTTRMQCVTPSEPHEPRNFGVVAQTLIYRGGQPASCSELEHLHNLGIRTIVKLNGVDADETQYANKLGMQVHSFAFDPTTIGTAESCAAVRDALAILQDSQNWPVYVHCAEGKDRTGFIIGLYERIALQLPIADARTELRHFGHAGWRSIVMGQIDIELAKRAPVCAKAR